MPTPQQISMSIFNGLNVRDAPYTLWLRSHTPTEGGWAHNGVFGLESHDLLNVDFAQTEGIRQRLGSTEDTDLTSFANLIAGIEYRNPATNSRVEVIVTTDSILTNQSGSFAKLNNAAGNTYSHNATVAKASFAIVDGHLFIGLDNGNPIQVYRIGASLEDQLYNDTDTTTVDADSASGQKVLNVASTDPFNVGDRIIINEGGAREETGYIASISAGVSVTMASNLSNTHTAAQADVVETKNQYTEVFGGATQDITGDWGVGYYILSGLHSRLLFGNGDSVLEYSDVDQPWDRLGGGFFQAPGAIRAVRTLSPEFSDSISEELYIFASNGWSIVTGFTGSDDLQRIDDIASPLNHQCVVHTLNWLMALTVEKTIIAINGTRIVDLGARLSNGTNGPLDGLNESNAETAAFGYYDTKKQQAVFFFPSGASSDNSDAVVVDMKEGEPRIRESQETAESHIRLLHWQLSSGSWFAHMYRRLGQTVGITAAGKLWATENGNDDLGSTAIESHWRFPPFNAGAPQRHKQWLVGYVRGLPTGDWDVNVSSYADRSTAKARTDWTYRQVEGGTSVYGTATYGSGVYSGSGIIKGADDTDLYSELIEMKIQNNNASETWKLTDLTLHYLIGAEER